MWATNGFLLNVASWVLPAAGIDEGSAQGRAGLVLLGRQSDVRSYCGPCSAPSTTAYCPGKPAAAQPIYQFL
jgi:hypothetical protein